MFIKKIFKPALASFTLSVLSSSVLADYVENQAKEITLPDGSAVTVYITGDEFYREVRSADGRLVVPGSDGYVYYAQLNATQTDLEPSSVRYDRLEPGNLFPLPFVKLPTAAIDAKRAAAVAENEIDKPQASNVNPLSLGTPVLGDVVGATVIIDFSDDPATFTHQQVNDLMNGQNYTEFGNRGSVNGYFKDVSGGKLNYTNLVTQYYRAAHPKTVYNDPSNNIGRRDLVREAIDFLVGSGLDLSQLTLDEDGRIEALNIYYAGTPDTDWSVGLWPHRSWYAYDKNGYSFGNYQMTSMNDSALSIGTFVHENGHMIADWPDLYDKQFDSSGTGRYCLMSDSGYLTPMPPNPYFRWLAGWETVIELNPAVDPNAPTGLLSATASSNISYVYSNPNNPDEFFFLENMHRNWRNIRTPDEGLMIWHVDAKGNNSDQQGTPERHYQVSIEQADGLNDLEKHANYGDANDLFEQGVEYQFTDMSRTAGVWWDRSVSGININTVSQPGPTITFRSEGVGVVDMSNINMGDSLYPLNAITGTPKYFRLELPDDTINYSVETFGGAGNVDLYVRHGALPTSQENDCVSNGSDNQEYCELNGLSHNTAYIMLAGSPIAANFNLKVEGLSGIVELEAGVPVENLSGSTGSEKYFHLAQPNSTGLYNWYTLLETTTQSGSVKSQIRVNEVPTSTDYMCEHNQLSLEPCITWAGDDYIRLAGETDYTGGILSVKRMSSLNISETLTYDAGANQEHRYNHFVSFGGVTNIGLNSTSGDAELYVRNHLPVTDTSYDCVVSANDGGTCPMFFGNYEILVRTGNSPVQDLSIELIKPPL